MQKYNPNGKETNKKTEKEIDALREEISIVDEMTKSVKLKIRKTKKKG